MANNSFPTLVFVLLLVALATSIATLKNEDEKLLRIVAVSASV
jgi:hypothetical protein